jgi:hypothetical protein
MFLCSAARSICARAKIDTVSSLLLSHHHLSLYGLPGIDNGEKIDNKRSVMKFLISLGVGHKTWRPKIRLQRNAYVAVDAVQV